MATVEAERAAEIQRQLDYFDAAMKLIDEGIFKIQTKDGGLVSYVPKREQRELYALTRKHIERGRPCAIIILKARQIGFSTAIAILFLALTLVRDTIDVVVAAHEEKSRNRIWKIYQIAYKNLPAEYLRCKDPITGRMGPRAKYDSRRELELRDNGSHIAVHVAGKGELGRSGATHLAHLSEFARWKQQKEDLNAVMESMPERPGSIAFIETTANGWGDHFHNMWLDAEKKEADKVFHPWRTFFQPWWKEPAYKARPQGPWNTEKGKSRSSRVFILDDVEERLVAEVRDRYSWHLNKSQLQWRRDKIAKSGGDVRLFDQENPSTPEHAFQSTGEHVFDPDALDYQIRRYVDEPLATYEIELTSLGDPFLRPTEEKLDDREVPVRGRLRLYRHPESRECLLMADPTHGVSEQSDPAAIHIFDVHSLEQVAVWEGRCDQHTFGDICVAMARHFNNAYSVIESNIGLTCIQRMLELGYANVHWHQPHGHHHADKTWQPGFRTTTASRDSAIRLLKRLVRERIPVLYDARTLKEMQSFQEIRTGTKFKAQAPKDKCDNLVMALAIGLYVGNAEHNWTTNGKLMRQRKFDPPEHKALHRPLNETTEQAAERMRRHKKRNAQRGAMDCR